MFTEDDAWQSGRASSPLATGSGYFRFRRYGKCSLDIPRYLAQTCEL